jgi:riboflavin biosynthesis pyrimidine reductase
MNSAVTDLTPYEFTDQVVANFVTTGFGDFKDEHGSSRGIGNEIDRNVLIHLRSRARAVLIGGETARVEGYKRDQRFKTFVLSDRDVQKDDGLHRFKAGSDAELKLSIDSICAEHHGLLVEAGPSLVSKLVRLQLIDILCLTVVHPIDDPAQLLKTLFGIDTAHLQSSQKLENTLLTIWRLK